MCRCIFLLYNLRAAEAVAARQWNTHITLVTCAPSSTSNVSGIFSTVAVRCAKLLASAADGANWKAAFARSLGAATSAPSSSQCKSYMLSPWQRRSKKLGAILTNGEDKTCLTQIPETQWFGMCISFQTWLFSCNLYVKFELGGILPRYISCRFAWLNPSPKWPVLPAVLQRRLAKISSNHLRFAGGKKSSPSPLRMYKNHCLIVNHGVLMDKLPISSGL